MPYRFNPKKEIPTAEAHGCIKYIIECGTVIFSTHARERMNSRNFVDQDVLHILETGNITGKEYDEERGNWKYKVSGCDVDGVDGKIVTAILTTHQQLIITVF